MRIWIVYRNGKEPGITIFIRYSRTEISREYGNPALTWQIVTNEAILVGKGRALLPTA